MTLLISSGTPLRIVEQAGRPFRYFLADQCLTRIVERDILAWFETNAPWRLAETDFYEQYEFSLFDSNLPGSLKSMILPDSLGRLRLVMGNAFQRRLSDRVNIVAHKLLPGQRIAIHNDYLSGEETHRLTVQINRGLSEQDGGFFMLFNSSNANDVHRVLRPVSGSAIGFEISPESHHAVSCLHGGERYTLVYSFYARYP